MRNSYTIEDFLEVKAAGGGSFSPDETRVAYISNETGTFQVFITHVEGGETEQLTDFEDSVSFVRFSPIEEMLIFGKAEGGNERTQFYSLDIATRQITNLTSRPDVRHNFGTWSYDGKSICFSSNERNGKDFDVYVMDLATLEKRCIFDGGEWCVAEGFSPQGTYVVVRKGYSNARTELYLCDLKTDASELITPQGVNAFHEGALWLPDESAFFLVQDTYREFKGLARFAVAEKKLEYVFTPEWDIDRAVIDPSGKHIALTVNENGYAKVTVCNALTLEIEPYHLPEGNIYWTKFSNNSSKIVFTLGDSRRTSDVWVYTLVDGQSKRLTNSHQGVPSDAMVEPELISFESFDGLSIPAFIYRPKRVSAGKTPVLINIHGGPESQYQPVYQPVIQYLVHSGYAVIAPNVRGSSGYGKSYMALDDKGKRLDSVKDIVALREYIANIPDMNAEKIALYGASYGGFMVLACMAFYPNLWAAGVDIVGIVNFITFLENTAPYRRAMREAEYGSLKEDREFLEKISPIHSIEKIQAPLFLIHGSNDPRVPLSEAEQVVSKLKELDKHVELLVYPDEGHGISKLKNKLDAYPKVIGFLNNLLGS